ncbi:hypothetical protein [Bacteroides sp. 519]|uniref:hypothetical protein n=1 Tax=Bacteroides sp. 519 TaxID=2302937 RepID=UPI0013D86655|nr:hypothetical protein [Bacteroides sp. 519]NDV60440.1 hypothetical protein [Bacteroides sp. 519]
MSEKNLRYVYIVALLCLFAACNSNTDRKRHLTERLFLERKHISISHPGNKTSDNRVLAEQVTFRNEFLPEEKDITKNEELGLDTNKIYTLSEVTVTSRARFAPVREGYINVDFLIHVPAGFLSDDFQIILVPELLYGDSVTQLNEVVLRGKNFIELQKQDYERYKNYLNSIVDPSAYDSVFVDHTGVNKELNRRRQNELGQYYQRWSLIQEYREWRNEEQARYDLYNIKQAENLRQKLRKHDSKYQVAFARQLATHQDTSALGIKYRMERKKIIDSSPVRKQITVEAVPARYREIYLKGINTEDLEPLLPQDADSLHIATEFVLHEKVAANEARGARQEEMFHYMVPTPYRPEAHYSATIVPEKDYTYRYTTTLPVVAGVKNLSLRLSGMVNATDRSHYKIAYTDKLTYVVSSIDELADGSLLGNNDFTTEQRREYTRALEQLRNRDYQGALFILNEYQDYNTALALACLGYDGRAYNLLGTLTQTANTHYLAAILCYRLKEKQAAVDHLLEACRLDPAKIDRAERDPEISKMIQDYNLKQVLER